MTTVSRPVHSEPRGEFDVRCSAGLTGRVGAEGRCQLFAGHEGPHAIMFGKCGERAVRTWRTGDAVAQDAEGLQRPWMFGFPVPAWFEDETPSALAP